MDEPVEMASGLSGLDQLSLELQNLKRIDEAVDRADSKSSIIATADIGMLTVLLGLFALITQLGTLTLVAWQQIVVVILFVLHIVPAMFSTGLAFEAVFPRLTRRSDSLYYFGTLASLGSAQAVIRRLEQAALADYQQAVREQIYHNACIAQAKFKYLRWSVRLMYVSGVAWLALMALLFILMLPTMAG
jgi:hypothetical protein